MDGPMYDVRCSAYAARTRLCGGVRFRVVALLTEYFDGHRAVSRRTVAHWPLPFAPQQYAPLTVAPHVWLPPALSEMNARPPATSTGVVRIVVVPSPNWPSSFSPQQKSPLVRPTVMVAQVCERPALSDPFAKNEARQLAPRSWQLRRT